MLGQQGLRFWIEVGLGAVSAILLVLTVFAPDWIERVFAAEPDGGDGSVEWGLTLALAVAAILLFLDAGRGLRKRREGSRSLAGNA